MKTHLYVLLTGFLLLLLQAQTTLAQTKIQVVTKTIERKLDYYKGTQLRITGEKASIKIQGWDKGYIGLTLKLISKHPDRAVAEQELEHMRYIIELNGNVHDVGNYFNVSKNANPIKANLKAEYTLMVPQSMTLLLNSKYGDASLSNTTGRSEITLEYSKLSLQNVSGDMQLTTTLGDVTGTNLNLDLRCEARRAEIELANASGTYFIENTYGHVKLIAGDLLKKLQVNGNRTALNFSAKNPGSYNYDLSTTHAEIALPAGLPGQAKTGSGGKQTYELTTDKKKPQVQLTTTNSPVTITQIR